MNKTKRITEFKNLGFGIFVHFGLYSEIGKGEWVKSAYNIPSTEYEKIISDFFVSESFAEELVLSAKNAGAKYITFTTRHHDGFSLYDTMGLNTYDAPHSACGRDLVREFVDACRKYGVIPFFYHTTMDWRHTDYNKDFPSYQKYLRSSIEILCKNYGKIGGFWFDGNWNKPDADWEEEALYSLIRKHQPEAIIINNTGLERPGEAGHKEIDCVTFERNKPKPVGSELAGEMCEVLCSHWGYAGRDINYKSMREILDKLIFCRSRNVNFLLNIGLKAGGCMRNADMAFLENIGVWTKTNDEALYHNAKSFFESNSGDFCIGVENGIYYAFVKGLEMVSDPNVAISKEKKKIVSLDNFVSKCKAVHWLDNNEELEYEQNNSTLNINCTPFKYGEDLIWRIAKIETTCG